MARLFSNDLQTHKQGKILFIDDINTNVGKTATTGWLMVKLMRQGFSVIA